MSDQPLQIKKSSQVHSATYDPQTGRFTAELNDGAWAAYHDVDSDIAYGIEQADSPGRYFHDNIRGPKNDPKHKFTRIR